MVGLPQSRVDQELQNKSLVTLKKHSTESVSSQTTLEMKSSDTPKPGTQKETQYQKRDGDSLPNRTRQQTLG